MTTRDFERKIYKLNVIIWHAKRLCELHHARRRVGVRLCCPALWAQGGPNHETNYSWVRAMSEAFRPVEMKVLANYIRGIGCKAEIYKSCAECAMPIVGEGGNNDGRKKAL